MKITRNINGQDVEIELTHDELIKAYDCMQFQYDCDWMENLMGEYGYDVDRVESDKIDELACVYRNYLERMDGLGIAEHEAFECAVQDFDFPEIDSDEEEAICQ